MTDNSLRKVGVGMWARRHKILRILLATALTANLVSCGSGMNNIEVKTAKETSAEHCEERGKCVKNPKGLVVYNPQLVTDNLVVKQETSNTLLSRVMNLLDEPKLLVIAEKLEPNIRGVALVSELEPCDSPKGIDGSNPTASSLRKLKQGRYKACLVYMGEGYLKRVMALDPINVDITAPDVSGSVTVSGLTPTSGIMSWSEAGDNVTLDGDLSYAVYLSTDHVFMTLEDVLGYGSPLPGKILGSTTYGMTSLIDKTLYHAAVVVSDEAGNRSLIGITNFSTPASDSIAPTVIISSNRDPGPTNLTALSLTFSFSEPVTGFDASDIQLVGGAKGAFTANDASTYTLAVTATGANVAATVPENSAEDLSGNKSLASSSWSITINGTASATVASPAAGVYTVATAVTLSTTTPGATIYYTLDNSTPTTSSSLYASPIIVSASQTINTVVVAPNYNPSAVTSHVYTITGTVSPPTFSVVAGAYGPAQSVTLSSATPGATIYYTTNGSNPTAASTQYLGAIAVSTSQTIKALAVLTNWDDSSVATAAYTINGAVATPTFSVAAGSYGPAQTVTLSTTTSGATIYYTTNGTDPTTASTVYSSAITVSSISTIKSFAIKSGFSDSAIASAAYTINGAVATPTFSVAEGAYGPAQTVTLSTATAGATIYYTTNGVDPTSASTVYSSAITISSTSTLKAFATKANFSDSVIASAAYTINGAVATPTFSVSAGVYGVAQSVTLSTTTAGATIYYTTNGTDPTTASPVYSTAITVSITSTIKAFATKSNFFDSAIASADYTINGAVAMPVFDSPAAGSYALTQSVAFSSSTSGATLYSTVDGSTPTCAHTGTETAGSPISLTASATVKVIACKSGYSDSAVASRSYTITFRDVTTDDAGNPSTCTANASRCTYLQISTGLKWMPPQGSYNWQAAMDYCSSLTYNGRSGWRAPTDTESVATYSSLMRNLPDFGTVTVWTSTASTFNSARSYSTGGSVTYSRNKGNMYKAICTRSPGPVLTISSPSPLTVNSSFNPNATVEFTVTYEAATAITLATSDISVVGTGTATASVLSVTGTGSSRTVTLSSFDGVGTVGISVAANTASDSEGSSPSAASNSTVIVNDTTAPSGYAVVWNLPAVNSNNETAAAFELREIEVDTTYNYTITSSGGGSPVTGSGSITSSSRVQRMYTSGYNYWGQDVTGINLSGLAAGTLTLSVTLTDTSNNQGNVVSPTSSVLKWPHGTWSRDSTSDDGAGGGIASNGLCDGTEDCVYTNSESPLYWSRHQATNLNNEAITLCADLVYGGYSDWRLPTLTETQSAFGLNIWSISSSSQLNLSTGYYWSSTINPYQNTCFLTTNLQTGWGAGANYWEPPQENLCVRP